MNCENCEACKAKQEAENIPFIAHESIVATLERTIKRLWILALALIFLLVGTNALWIWRESQFEDVVITQDVAQDAENGTNNFIGGDLIGETDNQNDN